MARQSSRGRGPASGRQAPQAQGMSSSSTPIDRRTALGLVGGAGALVALTACGGGNGGSSTSTTASSVVKAGTAVVPEGMPQLEAEVRDLHLGAPQHSAHQGQAQADDVGRVSLDPVDEPAS